MKKKYLMALMILCMGVSNITVNATEKEEEATIEEETQEQQEGGFEKLGEESEEMLLKDAEEYSKLLQLLVVCEDEEGNIHPIQGGSGFLIGDNNEGKYLITANEVVTVPEERKQEACSQYGIEPDDFETEIEVVVKRDVVITANIMTNSEDMNFAVLNLSQTIYDREPFILCDDNKSQYIGERVTLVGFPVACEIGQDVAYYTSKDVNIVSGTMLGESKLHEEKYIHHSMVPTIGNLGGAILNEQGDVIAINQSLQDSDGYYGLEIDAIMPVLKALGVSYKTSSQVAAEKQAALDAIVHKETLESNVKDALNYTSKEYTRKSMEKMSPVLDKALTILEKESATQKDVDTINQQLVEVIAEMKHKPSIWWYIIPAVSVTLMGSISLTIYLIKTKQKRKEKKKQKEEEMHVTQPAPVFGQQGYQQGDTYRRIVQQPISQSCESPVWNQVQAKPAEPVMQQYTVPQPYMDAGTQVLGQENLPVQPNVQSAPQSIATLIRCATGERIILQKPNFLIGKEKERVDYCISNNNAISRVHAMFIRMNNQYYLMDKKATNKTMLNGKILIPEQQYLLHDGDQIMFANEEFTFKM